MFDFELVTFDNSLTQSCSFFSTVTRRELNFLDINQQYVGIHLVSNNVMYQNYGGE